MKSFLKIVLFQSCILFVLSCSKKATQNQNPDSPITNNYVELKVLEDKTDMPIPNAEVRLQKCSNYSEFFGCTSYSTFSTLITDNEGKYKVLKSQSVDRISVTHTKYWQSSNTFLTDIKLIPEGFSKVHLKKINNYSSDYIMSVYPLRSDVFILNPQETRFAIPSDSIFYLRCYGNYDNVVGWSIGKWVPIIQIIKEGQSSPFFAKAFDTTAVEINF